MSKNFLFAIVSFFVVTNLYQDCAWAGTESWYSGENWNGGVVVRDRYDNGSDRDAFLIFDALGNSARSAGRSLIKSFTSPDRLFTITCKLDLQWNEAQCRLDLKQGKTTTIDRDHGALGYKVTGADAEAWSKVFSPLPFNYVSGDGRMTLKSSKEAFEFRFVEKRK